MKQAILTFALHQGHCLRKIRAGIHRHNQYREIADVPCTHDQHHGTGISLGIRLAYSVVC